MTALHRRPCFETSIASFLVSNRKGCAQGLPSLQTGGRRLLRGQHLRIPGSARTTLEKGEQPLCANTLCTYVACKNSKVGLWAMDMRSNLNFIQGTLSRISDHDSCLCSDLHIVSSPSAAPGFILFSLFRRSFHVFLIWKVILLSNAAQQFRMNYRYTELAL